MDNLKKELGQLKKVFDDKKKQATSTPATLPKPQDSKATAPKKPLVTKPEDEEKDNETEPDSLPPQKSKPNPFNAKKKSGDDDDSDDSLPDVPADNRKRFRR